MNPARSVAVRDRTTAARFLNTILPGKVHMFDEVLVTAVTEGLTCNVRQNKRQSKMTDSRYILCTVQNGGRASCPQVTENNW
jgi:hypothetical protein